MRSLGRGLQATALVLLLVGLFFGMARGPNAMALEIGFLLGGVAVFLLGLGLQQKSGG